MEGWEGCGQGGVWEGILGGRGAELRVVYSMENGKWFWIAE